MHNIEFVLKGFRKTSTPAQRNVTEAMRRGSIFVIQPEALGQRCKYTETASQGYIMEQPVTTLLLCGSVIT